MINKKHSEGLQIHRWTMRRTDVSKLLVDRCINKETDLVGINIAGKIDKCNKITGQTDKSSKIKG